MHQPFLYLNNSTCWAVLCSELVARLRKRRLLIILRTNRRTDVAKPWHGVHIRFALVCINVLLKRTDERLNDQPCNEIDTRALLLRQQSGRRAYKYMSFLNFAYGTLKSRSFRIGACFL